MTYKKLSFVFEISQTLKMFKKWFSSQNEPNNAMFQMRKIPKILACKAEPTAKSKMAVRDQP